MLCTIADIKARLGLSDETKHDTLMTRLVAAVSKRADVHTGRILQDTGADVTEYYTPLGEMLQLERYPVVSITSVKESWDHDFDAATALVADTDYRLLRGGRTGILERLWTCWPTTTEGVQVVYRGGFAAPDAVLGAGETALPDDLREAAILQCCFLFQRRDTLGVTGTSFEGGGHQYQPVKLLPEVQAVLDSYRRIAI